MSSIRVGRSVVFVKHHVQHKLIRRRTTGRFHSNTVWLVDFFEVLGVYKPSSKNKKDFVICPFEMSSGALNPSAVSSVCVLFGLHI